LKRYKSPGIGEIPAQTVPTRLIIVAKFQEDMYQHPYRHS